MNFTHGSLFSGIGGFDLAAEWMGWENKFHCEWNEFGQNILKHYWPKSESYGDIKKTDFTIWRNRIDILTGGFPCQPYSVAGKRLGKEDERHLWPEMLRAIREIQPRYVVGENVFGLLNWNGGLVFDEVQSDLENAGYQVWAAVLPAAGKNAPHKRDRVWFVAYTNNNGNVRTAGENESSSRKERLQKRNKIQQSNEPDNIRELSSNAFSERLRGKGNRIGEPRFINKKSSNNDWGNFPAQHPICSGNDGLSAELDGITFSKWRSESIKAYGNAIVPQVVYEIFKAIEKTEKELNL